MPRCQQRQGPSAGKGHGRRRAHTTDSATQEDQCHQKKIFVGGLGSKTTTQTVREYFQKYGAIVDAVVLRWPDGRSRGFGYITFAGAASASAVLREPHAIGGCEVDVKRAVPGTNKLFVGGLPQNITASEMRMHFEQFGIVSDAVVMMDAATNRSRGFGFICFSPGPDGAAAVATALEQYDRHYLRGKWIEVKGAAPPRQLVAEPDAAAPTTTKEAAASPPGLGAAGYEKEEAAAPTLAPPPGLLIGGGCGEAAWVQAGPWAAGAAAAAASPAPTPLPCLLASTRPGQFCRSSKGGPPPPFAASGGFGGGSGFSFEPMKLPLPSSEATTGGDADVGLFGASLDFRRSLEELLRLQSEPARLPAAQ